MNHQKQGSKKSLAFIYAMASMAGIDVSRIVKDAANNKCLKCHGTGELRNGRLASVCYRRNGSGEGANGTPR